MKNNFIEAGKIVNTHGMKGEVKLQPWADSPGFLTGFEYFYIGGVPVKVVSARVQKGCVIAALEGVGDIDAAIRMKNKIVSVKREDAALDEGRFFISDIVGLRAIDSLTGGELGIVIDVLTYPANNVYVVKGGADSVSRIGKEFLIPAVSEFIVETNISEGYIKLRLIDGMLD